MPTTPVLKSQILEVLKDNPQLKAKELPSAVKKRFGSEVSEYYAKDIKAEFGRAYRNGVVKQEAMDNLPKGRKLQLAREYFAKHANLRDGEIVNLIRQDTGISVSPNTINGVRHKRYEKKRPTAAQPANPAQPPPQPKQQSQQLNFCPHCGFNLTMVNIAFQTAEAMLSEKQ